MKRKLDKNKIYNFIGRAVVYSTIYFIAVAGKGHEDYQIFADKTIHFDDSEVIQEAFKEIKK